MEIMSRNELLKLVAQLRQINDFILAEYEDLVRESSLRIATMEILAGSLTESIESLKQSCRDSLAELTYQKGQSGDTKFEDVQ